MRVVLILATVFAMSLIGCGDGKPSYVVGKTYKLHCSGKGTAFPVAWHTRDDLLRGHADAEIVNAYKDDRAESLTCNSKVEVLAIDEAAVLVRLNDERTKSNASGYLHRHEWESLTPSLVEAR